MYLKKYLVYKFTQLLETFKVKNQLKQILHVIKKQKYFILIFILLIFKKLILKRFCCKRRLGKLKKLQKSKKKNLGTAIKFQDKLRQKL